MNCTRLKQIQDFVRFSILIDSSRKPCFKMDVAISKVAERFEIYSQIYQVPFFWFKKQNTSKSGRTDLKNKSFYRGYVLASLYSLLCVSYIFRLMTRHVLSSVKDPDLTLTAGLLSTVIGLLGIIIIRYDYESLYLYKELSFIVTEMKTLSSCTSKSH